jgi:hypothetical protein
MQKLKHCFKAWIGWCKRHPYITLFVIMMLFFINWPPLPWQPLTWEVKRYVWKYGVKTDADPIHAEKHASSIALGKIVKKFIHVGMTIQEAERIMKINGWDCYYRDTSQYKNKSETDLACYLESVDLPVKLPTLTLLLEPASSEVYMQYSLGKITEIRTYVD